MRSHTIATDKSDSHGRDDYPDTGGRNTPGHPLLNLQYNQRITVRTCHSKLLLSDLLKFFKRLYKRIKYEASSSG